MTDKAEKKAKPEKDLTGREQMVGNVIASWAGHFVFIAAGFVMPRLMDEKLGQDMLGVWDFAWSLVGYFALVQAGVASSVNRYVARYRAENDHEGVNRVVSSALCILGIAGLLVIFLSLGASLLLSVFFSEKLKDNVDIAQWVVFYLGAGMGIEMMFNPFSGVLTGCHHWKLHNLNKSGWHAVAIGGMIAVLLCGSSLAVIALVYMAGQILACITRVILAYKVCDGLQVKLQFVSKKMIKELFVFGGKTLLPSISKLLMNSTISVLIVAYMGPGALALFCRPRSLIMHMNTMVNKMAFVLTPTASSLQKNEDIKAIQNLLIKSVRYSMYMVLPMVLMMVIFGDCILQLWMGEEYANGLIIAIMAAGYMVSMVQLPIQSILAGLNAHGKAGVAHFVTAIVVVLLAFLALGPLDMGLVGIALAVAIPLTILNVTYMPYLICRKLDLNIAKYAASVSVKPLIIVLPFAICLLAARLLFSLEPMKGFLWGTIVGGVVLMILYWRYVLPDQIRNRLYRVIKFPSSAVIK